jgi:hypothetical protein
MKESSLQELCSVTVPRPGKAHESPRKSKARIKLALGGSRWELLGEGSCAGTVEEPVVEGGLCDRV